MNSLITSVVFVYILGSVFGQTENVTEGVTTETTSQTTSQATSQTPETTTTETTLRDDISTTEYFDCNGTCLYGGTCLANGRCSCDIWYSGERCETMIECPPGACSLAGTISCTVNMSMPICHCDSRYVGIKCEHENLCLKYPCKNNGTCETNQDGNYTCTCLVGDPKRDCDLNELDACLMDPPDGPDKYIACIDHIVGKDMLCSPQYTGIGCKQPRNPSQYCLENTCFQDTGACKPLCNRAECNGTDVCKFSVFNLEPYSNVTEDCRRSFADGYFHGGSDGCGSEENLFDGFDGIRAKLKDCSPFFDTICTRNLSDGICNPYCNNEECLWDGLDCVNETLQTLGGSVIIELNQVAPRTYSKLSLVMRSGLNFKEHYNGSRKMLQLKVVKPAEFNTTSNNTIGQFTSITSAGLFLASFLAKLPLDLHEVTDVYVCEPGRYGNKCLENCSSYCTKEGDICDFMTGYCLHGCRTGWWGDMCTERCPRGCSGACDRVSGKCNSCVDGRYGAENCSLYCDAYCRPEACNVTTGECNCGEGRYYSFENSTCKECGEGCIGNCGENGFCTCKSGFYGSQCIQKCSSSCHNESCDVTDGRCSGCKSGFYGDRCQETCSEGCMECNQDTGSCGGNCKDGFVGENCQRSAQPETDNTGVIVAVVIAIIILLTIIIIAFCYGRYRQSGDYIVKEEEDMEPVPKATSQEVKAHYGMQPLFTSPMPGHSSDMIDMDSEKPAGGVYAGPAVTVAYYKDEDAVDFDNSNKTTAVEGEPEQPNVEEEGLERRQTTEVTTVEGHPKASDDVPDKREADLDYRYVDDSKEDLSGEVDKETGDRVEETDEQIDEKGTRAPLASEEDLTASRVPRDGITTEGNNTSLDSLEKAAIDALENADNEAGSRQSSSSSEHSRHSRKSSSSSSSSKSSDRKETEDQQLLTEM